MKRRGIYISTKYLTDRHEAPADDGSEAAIKLVEMKGNKRGLVFISDDIDFDTLAELVTGAWHYEGIDAECDMRNIPGIKMLCRTANRIRKRWEGRYNAEK